MCETRAKGRFARNYGSTDTRSVLWWASVVYVQVKVYRRVGRSLRTILLSSPISDS